jgi:hypothetical protein
MPPFMNEGNKENRPTIYFVVDVEGEGLRPSAWESMRPDVITSTPFNNLTNLSGNAFPQRACQAWGSFCVTLFCV